MKLKLEKTDIFQEKYVPADTSVAGLSALVQGLNVMAPVRNPVAVSKKRFKESIKETSQWRIFDNKYAVEPTIDAHLTFAMRHENIDLLVLKRIFQALPEKKLPHIFPASPPAKLPGGCGFCTNFLPARSSKYLIVEK